MSDAGRETQLATNGIEDLLRNAAARESLPEAEERAIREALRNEWQALTRRRRWRRYGLAAAAVLVLAIAATQRPAPGPESAADTLRLARVEQAIGAVRVRRGGDASTAAEAGLTLHAGQEVVTGNGARLSFRWRDGSSVRVDEHTSLHLTGSGAIDLARGRVYVDAGGPSADADAPVILTPAGPVRHLGTQYMAAVRNGVTRISVREGLVAVGAGQRTASGGQELAVGPGGRPSFRAIPVYGDDWLWAQALAEPFESDGKTIADFLDWVGRETGHRVEFASAKAARLAGETELRGTIELDPMSALEPVLQTSDLVCDVDDGIIRVRLRTDD